MSNFLTAEFPDNSPSTGAWLWSSSILLVIINDLKEEVIGDVIKGVTVVNDVVGVDEGVVLGNNCQPILHNKTYHIDNIFCTI